MASATASVAEDATNESTRAIHRWRSKSKTQTPTSNMSIPLVERTNTKSTFTTTTNGSTTFLPELYSTPPMPTFQKPIVETGSPLQKGKEAAESAPPRPYVPRRPQSDGLRPSTAPRPSRPTVYCTTPLIDRIAAETPPLPATWGPEHDRAICILDARNYALPAIVAKMRRTFPVIRGALTPAMIDRRLRQLDQDVNINYWSIGLGKSDEKERARDRKTISRQESKASLVGNDETTRPEALRGDAAFKTESGLLTSQSTSDVESGGPRRNTVTDNFLTGFRSHVS